MKKRGIAVTKRTEAEIKVIIVRALVELRNQLIMEVGIRCG